MNDSLANFCHTCFAILAPSAAESTRPDLGAGPSPGQAGYASTTPYVPFPPPPAPVPGAPQGSVGGLGGGQQSQSSLRRKLSIPIGAFVLIFVMVRLVSGVIDSTSSGTDSPPTSLPPTFDGSAATLPQEAGGYTQVSSGRFAKVANNYRSKTDPLGTAAAYGKAGKTAFIVALLPSLNGFPPEDLLDVLGSGFRPAAAGSSLGSTTTETRGTATIACAPMVTPAPYRTMCTAGGAVPSVVIFGFDSDTRETLEFTSALANDL